MRGFRKDRSGEPDYVQRWRRSEKAPCCLCGRNTDQGLLQDDGIIAGYGSKYDTHSLLWLGGPRDPVAEPEGTVCDDCIDRLVAQRRVEVYWSGMNGPASAPSPECVEAAFRLGIARMERTLAKQGGGEAVRSAFDDVLHLVAGHQDHRADNPDPERAGNLLTLAVRAAFARSPTEHEVAKGVAAFAERADWKRDHDATMAWMLDALKNQMSGESDETSDDV